jgi:rhomboid protease GluP
VKTPFATMVLVATTLIASSTVFTMARGTPWKSVNILSLRHYGAVDNAQLANGEWWRLLTAQFVHVRPAHMLFNVVALLVIGTAVEQAIGPLSFLLLWVVSGTEGVLASIYHLSPPMTWALEDPRR